MSESHRVCSLKDNELLSALSTIVRRSNELTAQLIEHLAELDQRQLHLGLGFPSLFAYCVQSLGLCEATAGRRIAVARVCSKYPEALARVATGELHVSALCLLKQHLNGENAAELFELCSRKSAREVEVLLAARFPKPEIRDSIRRLPAPNPPALPPPTLNVESAQETRAGTSAQALVDRAPQLAQSLTPPALAPRLEPLSPDRFAVRFTADAEFRDALERVRGLAAHRLPSGDLLTLLKHGLQAYERELEKQRFAVGIKPRRTRRLVPTRASVESPPHARSRVPAAVVREVYQRDEKQCTFVSKDGRRCCARKFLELDHVQPWAFGGDDTPRNLRLRCRAHNQRYARLCFGPRPGTGSSRAAREPAHEAAAGCDEADGAGA